ncbi:MAG: hypothetical protein V4564_22605 [Pseudomonadota bacterium]|uniref:hypothetical protein n=1 Tax=Sphingomonas sp. ERG5 TaxID=1381597 RepID=UPI001364A692|nr:hypothetical protein [Sphingomonas sp. ERG5]
MMWSLSIVAAIVAITAAAAIKVIGDLRQRRREQRRDRFFVHTFELPNDDRKLPEGWR